MSHLWRGEASDSGTSGSCVFSADHVVLLASSGHDSQRAQGRFSAECELAGMRVSSCRSGGCPKKRSLNYLQVFFMSDGLMKLEMGGRIRALAAVEQSLLVYILRCGVISSEGGCEC